MAIKVEIRGLDGVDRMLTRAGRKIPDAAGTALYAAGRTILSAAQAETPRRTGALAASGHVDRPQHDEAGDLAVRIAFGGRRIPRPIYGQIMHWSQRYRHSSGKARFLIDPFERLAQRAVDEARRAVARASRGV